MAEPRTASFGSTRWVLVVAASTVLALVACGSDGTSASSARHATTVTRDPSGPTPAPAEPGHDHGAGCSTRAHTSGPRRYGDRFVTRIECDTLTVSRFRRGTVASAAQRSAAERLVAGTLAELRRVRNPATAEQLGFRRVDTHHWVKPAFLDDGRVLDPRRPESLIFDVDPALSEPLVIGAMYLVPPGEHGPQVGGPPTTWHYHEFSPPVCTLDGAFPVGSADTAGRCAEGSPTGRSAEMLHVWVENPRGRFDSRMTLPSDAVVERIRRALDR